MAKKKSSFGTFDPAAITMGAREAIGSDESSICGVKVPSLAMQYLLNSTVLPVGRIMEIYGKPGAGKSTFLYEVMRWFLDVGGYCYLGETEGKDSVALRRSVCKWNFEQLNRVLSRYDTSFEGWSSSLRDAITYFDDAYEQYGKVFPVLYSIDAVTSVETEKSIKDYAEEGELKVAYASLALHLSKLLRDLPSMYSKKPYLFAFVNHVKEKINATAWGDNKTLPGGSALYFASHLILELEYVGQTKKAGSTIRNIKIRIEKNGIQEKGKSFIVPVRYWSEQDPTDPEKNLQQIMYDWNTADINFLIDQETSKDNSAEKRRAISAIVDLNQVRLGTENAVWSEALGIPEDEPQNYHNAGETLHKNVDVMRKLQGYFVTTDSIAFGAGEDYNSVLEKANEAQQLRYKAISDALYKKIVEEDIKKEDN